jgi:hypothetical protein
VRRFIRSFGLPILLVGLLAGTLGFYVARAVAGDTSERIAEVSVVSLPATPSPTPSPVPSPTAGTARGRRGTRDPRCPSGCECSFPSGGTVVVCRGGGTVRVP